MAVKDFLAVEDAKKTIEKEVKQRPKIEELTTIESPGKPTPATFLEDNKKTIKKRKHPKKPTSSPNKISAPKKDSILIITEKPQAAQKIALALGSPRRSIEKNVSYYELTKNGEKIIVSSAVGHLFNLEYVKGQKGWPIFKIEWRPSYEKKSGAFTRRYFETLKKLSKKAKEIIIATDYDAEGEVIGWNVARFICNSEKAKRMKYSTLTKTELQNSFENLMPEINWNQAYSGETRHILDWLYGINLSRGLMSAIKTSGSFKILSIGRVQGPALKIIVEREKEIQAFKPEPFWRLFAIVDDFPFQHPKDIFNKEELKKFENIKEGTAITTKKEESILPPPPFDLTTLQRESYRVNGMSPSQTLATAQKLYLSGLISYPRTSSQKIPSTIEPKKILKVLEKSFPEAKKATRAKPVEGKKEDPAHPSIYPTGEFSPVKEAEKKLYELIVKRFISVFSHDAITQNKKVTITSKENPEIKFTASGLKIKEKGWTSVYPATLEEKEIPTLNGEVKIEKIKIEEKETQPPKRYTPASLISILEKKNLGTKATRSIIVDILFDRGYLDGKSIQATALGMQLINTLEKYSPIIIDENLTRQFEDEMEKLSETKNSKSVLEKKEKEIIQKAEKIITDISKEFKSKEIEIGKEILKGVEIFREQQKESNTLIRCPTCKKGDLRILYSKKSGKYFVACSAYPECRQTYSLPPNALIKKSGKDCPECNFPKLLSIKKGKRPWEFCFNPNCPANIKRREEWEKRKQENIQSNQDEGFK